MNTRSLTGGAAWLPIIIVLAIIVIGVGYYMYSQPATDGGDTATTTADAMLDQSANAGAATDGSVDAGAEVDTSVSAPEETPAN